LRFSARPLSTLALAAALLLGLAAGAGLPAGAAGAAGAPPAPARSYYLVLGDSIAFGFEASVPARSYVGILFNQELKQIPGLFPISYACGGATTASMIDGPACGSTTGSQLAQAESFLRGQRGEVALVTLTIGINDIDGCMTVTTIIEPCVAKGEALAARQLPEILSGLSAADPGVRIVGMNYYDPYLAAWLSGPAGQAVAARSLTVFTAFNAQLAAIYRQHGVRMADVAGRFASSDSSTASYAGRTVPRNVAEICTMTSMCTRADIHPNDLGYAAIAQAYTPFLPTRFTGTPTADTTRKWIAAGALAAVVVVIAGGVTMRRRRTRRSHHY
jgi:lysophospholipase L1-like esterase